MYTSATLRNLWSRYFYSYSPLYHTKADVKVESAKLLRVRPPQLLCNRQENVVAMSAFLFHFVTFRKLKFKSSSAGILC